jgi:autotransporter translocation and assembly factor TamB
VRKRAGLVAIIVAILVAGVLVVRRHEVIAALLPRIIGAATGYDVAIGAERFGFTHGALLEVHVRRGGDPVLDAKRIDIWYNPRDLLPGSAHRYGVNAIAIDAPTLTLVRHQDGSYNVSIPRASPSGPEIPHPYDHVPIALTVRIRDGAGSLRAPFALDPQARNLGVRDFGVDADIDSLGRTHYRLYGEFIETVGEPFDAVGTIDMTRGYAMHHVRAAAVPMRSIGNFFINSKAARILAGTATDLDLHAYALGIEPGQDINYSLGATLDVAGGQMHIVGLAVPLRQIHGNLQLVNDTFFVRNLSASLAGVPVQVNGGLIDFADPHYQLGIVARGDLSNLRNALTFARGQAVSGAATALVEVQGALDSPQISATLDAANVVYRTVPMHAVHAAISYADSIVTVAPLQATVSGARATVRGRLVIGDNDVRPELAVHVDATADELPYLGELLGTEPVAFDGVADGIGTDFEGFGSLTGTRAISRVAALVRLRRGGIVDIAPFWLNTQRGSFAGAYHLDRTTDRSAFWFLARNVALTTPKRMAAFGLALPVFPAIDGTLDSFAVQGGGGSGQRAVVGGSIRAHDTTIGGVALTHLTTSFVGTLADAAMAPIAVDGPWGSLSGTGAVSLHGIAVRGAYRGTLEGLRPFLAGTPASGEVDGTAALALAPGRITIQADPLHFHHAVVRGLPLNDARGTLAVENGTVRVLTARASVAGGEVVAAGAYASGIALVANHLDGAHVRGIGLPIDAGELSARGSIAAGAPLPQFDGGFSVSNGRAQRYAVAGTGLVHLHGDRVDLDHVVGALGGDYAFVSGDVAQLTSGAPAYDLHARVPAGDVGRTLATLGLPSFSSDGTFNADLAVLGAGIAPRVRGPIGVPAGSINGLPFTDASAEIVAGTGGGIARTGAVQVGSTHLTFSGAKNPRVSSIDMDAPQADLSDFDNFFDTGDTLAGRGRVKLAVISQRHRISTSADVNIAGLRYRNLVIGDTRANWSSAHSEVKGTLAIGGTTGVLRAGGSIVLATDRSPFATMRDSRYDVDLTLDDLDLSTWVAALGFQQVPVTGRVAGTASVQGRFPALQLSGTAQLHDGTIWRLPIETAQLAFASHANQITLTSASLVATGLTATANGTFGLQSTAPLNVSVYLNSDEVESLVAQLYRIHLPITGNFESTVTVRGSIAKPAFSAAFDASDANFYGVAVPSIFGSLALVDGNIQLRNAGAQFATGDITMAGTLPLRIDPFGIGPKNAPLNLDLAVDGLDPSVFATLAGNGTKLGGTIDGALGVSGTVASPRIYGKFGIAGGSYVSELETIPVKNIAATLQFSRADASVDGLSAQFGSGTLTGSGHIAFGDGATFAVDTTARGAQLDVPKFGSGTVNGTLSFARSVAGAPALLSGNVTLSSATIPFAAFAAATGAGASGGSPPLQLPFGIDYDVKLAAAQGVRVRGSGFGAGLDIGGTGSVQLAGTLAAPTLDGTFTSTGGTLTYFDRAFRVQQARVAFDPAIGLLPTLHATGTTHVTTGDSNNAFYGGVDVTIKVDGPLDALAFNFTTNPPGYSNQQVIAMIAPFGGLIGSAAREPTAAPTAANGVVPLGALAPIPAARAAGAVNGSGISVGEEAFNLLNAQFVSGLMAPVEGALSNGLGVQNVNVTLDYYGNVGISATRLLGKTVNLIYSTTFGIPVRQSVAFQLVGHAVTAQLSLYVQNGNPPLFKSLVPSQAANSALAVGLPLEGGSGFAFTLERLYW